VRVRLPTSRAPALRAVAQVRFFCSMPSARRFARSRCTRIAPNKALDAGDSGLEAVHAVRDTTASAAGALEDVVHKGPFAMLAIAIGLGFLFGATWRR
jgi:ElaB/YqjD/DUF883 family membrane-anchored ribosome-binding protein